jgi:hypothetical protein
MLLEKFDKDGLLINTTVLGKTSDKGIDAFRGDLVLIEGALRAGSTTDRKPPELLMNQTAILANSEKLIFVNGLFTELTNIKLLLDKYRDYLTPQIVFLCYVENIDVSMQVELEGFTLNLIPYKEGMIWNETLELLYIEKADLKGQSAEDKVVTVFEAAKQYKSKSPAISYEAASQKTIVVKKEAAVGPV